MNTCPGCSDDIEFDGYLNFDELCAECSAFIEAAQELNKELKEESDDVHV